MWTLRAQKSKATSETEERIVEVTRTLWRALSWVVEWLTSWWNDSVALELLSALLAKLLA
jgi:hypothetical protein